VLIGNISNILPNHQQLELKTKHQSHSGSMHVYETAVHISTNLHTHHRIYNLNLTLVRSNSPMFPIPARLHFSLTNPSSIVCLNMPLSA
jgi:hypothetical protein